MNQCRLRCFLAGEECKCGTGVSSGDAGSGLSLGSTRTLAEYEKFAGVSFVPAAACCSSGAGGGTAAAGGRDNDADDPAVGVVDASAQCGGFDESVF